MSKKPLNSAPLMDILFEPIGAILEGSTFSGSQRVSSIGNGAASL